MGYPLCQLPNKDVSWTQEGIVRFVADAGVNRGHDKNMLSGVSGRYVAE